MDHSHLRPSHWRHLLSRLFGQAAPSALGYSAGHIGDVATTTVEVHFSGNVNASDYAAGVTIRKNAVTQTISSATLTDDGELKLWHGLAGRSNPPSTLGLGSPSQPADYPPRMFPAEIRELIIYLNDQLVGHDRLPVTWNGLGFDFRILADEIQNPVLSAFCRMLALAHVDIAFQMLCEKGFMIGLDAAAKGMGLPGKTEGMNGAKAPAMWQQGREEQVRVLEYVAQDVRTTAGVYEAILHKRSLTWTSRRGSPAIWSPAFSGDRLLTVAAGAGQRRLVPAKAGKVQRITVPDPPQAEIVAAGRTGIHCGGIEHDRPHLLR